MLLSDISEHFLPAVLSFLPAIPDVRQLFQSLRGGYKHHFPCNAPLNDTEVEQAHQKDATQRLQRQESMNMSTHRKESKIHSEQTVMIKNHNRRKFDPYFGPTPYKVVATEGSGLIIQRETGDKQTLRRHCDDAKSLPVGTHACNEPPIAMNLPLPQKQKHFGYGNHVARSTSPDHTQSFFRTWLRLKT